MQQHPESAMRQAMKVLEVILKAMGREIEWIEAADLLGVMPRTIRRCGSHSRSKGARRVERPAPGPVILTASPV